MNRGRKPGIPNKTSLLATADMDRLGINPIEMLKKVFDEAMTSYYESKEVVKTATGNEVKPYFQNASSHLSIAAKAASDLAAFKHPKLSAVAFKDLSDGSESSRPATTQEAIEILKKDPFAVKTSEVVKQMDSAIETPALPKGENEKD